eukprot:129864-Rhodomonas_salina.2
MICTGGGDRTRRPRRCTARADLVAQRKRYQYRAVQQPAREVVAELIRVKLLILRDVVEPLVPAPQSHVSG